MPEQYTYILVNFFAIFVCFVASFDRRIRFDRQFGTFLLSSSVVAVPFILWDIWFTSRGVWWFDTNYTLGIVISGLPVEEWLFFLVHPLCLCFYLLLSR